MHPSRGSNLSLASDEPCRGRMLLSVRSTSMQCPPHICVRSETFGLHNPDCGRPCEIAGSKLTHQRRHQYAVFYRATLGIVISRASPAAQIV